MKEERKTMQGAYFKSGNALPSFMKLYAVTDRKWLTSGETLEGILKGAIEGGVTMVQLREKDASDDFILQEAEKIGRVCREYGVPFILNDRVDLAKAAGADGVHVGQSDMDIRQAREILGDDFIIGGSAHNVQEALAAEAAGADYLGCGAVFGSDTKRDASLLGIEELRKICSAVSIPVVAIGGITLENASKLVGTGIAGIAVVSGIFAANDKKKAAKEFMKLAETKV